MIITRIASQNDLASIHALYIGCGYGGGVNVGDKVIVAVLCDQLVGAVRLCREYGVIVLRGMQVKREYQRRGIGHAMLMACKDSLDEGCLPYSHLVEFYRLVGFRPAPLSELPAFLEARLQQYISSGQDILAMFRTPGCP